MFDKIIRYDFNLNMLDNWEFCNEEDGKLVMYHLEQNNKVQYSYNKIDNCCSVWIFSPKNRPYHIANIKPKI